MGNDYMPDYDDTEERDPITGLTPSEQEAYERWCFEQACEDGFYLPMPLPRTDEGNLCDACGGPPTAENPTWRYAGQQADLENGPSERELPTTLHEMCG
jgi:hypothetical protein